MRPSAAARATAISAPAFPVANRLQNWRASAPAPARSGAAVAAMLDSPALEGMGPARIFPRARPGHWESLPVELVLSPSGTVAGPGVAVPRPWAVLGGPRHAPGPYGHGGLPQVAQRSASRPPGPGMVGWEDLLSYGAGSGGCVRRHSVLCDFKLTCCAWGYIWAFCKVWWPCGPASGCGGCKDGSDTVISSFWTRKTACMCCERAARATLIGISSAQVLGVLFVRSLRWPGCSEILAVETLYH